MARNKSRRLVIVSAAVVATATLAFFGYSVMARSSGDIDPSKTAAVERGEIARSVVATGRIEPIAKVEIKSKANGIIEALLVEEGDTVTEGQVLAELDKENLAARLREAKAAHSGAEASLVAARAELEKTRVEAEGPDVPYARRNLERAEQLARDHLISEHALDEARGALEVALNRQAAARSNLGVKEARVAEAKAAVEQAAAAVARAQEELNNATIRSPIRGVVLSRNVEIGSPVSSILNLGSAATLVMVLGDTSQVYVRGQVDEADIGSVALGQPARIKVETFRDRLFEGKVTQIAPMGVERDNVVNFEVRVSIDNPLGALRANMTANAEIVLEEHNDVLIVPEAAIVYDSDRRTWVDVVAPEESSGSRRVPVRLGISNGTRTEVLSGLDEGQRVIVP